MCSAVELRTVTLYVIWLISYELNSSPNCSLDVPNQKKNEKIQYGSHWENYAPKVLKLTIQPNYSFNNINKLKVNISLDS